MRGYKDLLSIQIVFGAVFILLAGLIAGNFIAFLQLNQASFNALMLAFVTVFLLKDGIPNFILGLQEYIVSVSVPKVEQPEQKQIGDFHE